MVPEPALASPTDQTEVLRRVLRTGNVSKIYYVDDAHSNTIDYLPKVRSVVIKLGEDEKLETLLELKDKIEIDELDAQIINGKIEQLWSELTVEEQFDFYTRILKINNDKGELERAALKSILAVSPFKEFINFLTPSEWIGQKDKILSSVNEVNRIVVLMDQELGLPGDTKGIDILKQIPESENTYLTLFTYSITQLDEEVPTRNTLHREKGFPKKRFFVLTKDRAKDDELFIDGVKKVLLNGYFDQMKEKALKIYSDSLAATENELEDIDTHDFDMAVIRSSLKEGLWEPETLFRIIKILLEKNTRLKMIEKNFPSEINGLIRMAKVISKSHECVKYHPEYAKNYAMRHKEIYDSGEIVNKLRMPIENGDIFEIINGKKTFQYILVGQECDLMLRSDNSNKKYYSSIFKIEKCDHQQLTERRNAFNNKFPLGDYMANRFRMDYFENGKKTLGMIRLSEELVVDRRILDLTTINEDGVSKLSMNSEIEESHLSFSQLRHVKEIKVFLDKEIKNQTFEGTQATSIKIPFAFLSKDMKNEFLVNNNSIEFGVKRVMRLRKPYSNFLLDKYHHSKRRDAEDHDFASY